MKHKLLYSLLFLTSSSLAAPSGFNVVFSEGGVTLYKKNYSGGKPDYVQKIDLSTGAKIKLQTGKVSSQNSNEGGYGGKNPSIYKDSLSSAWSSLKSKDSNAACIVNGQFFATSANPTTLAFPVKIDGDAIDGYGVSEYTGQKLILNINDGSAEITPFGDYMPDLSDNAIVGLSKHANKEPDTDTGRTFIGVSDENNDGSDETVYIFSSKLTSQNEAAKVLSDFGASDVMMLDGGGSSQLICNGTSYVSSTRKIPQTIATIKANEVSVTYKEKVDFVFDNLESKYRRYFPEGNQRSIKTGGNYYRYYRVNGSTNYVYAYNKNLWYKIGSGGWKKSSSIDAWYNSFK